MIKRKNECITINDAFNRFMLLKEALGVADATKRYYVEGVKRILKKSELTGEEPMRALNEDVYLQYILKEKGRVSNETINNTLRAYRTFIYFCSEKFGLESYKIKLLKKTETGIKFFEDDEVEKLLAKPPKNANFNTYRTWVIVCFILATGARAKTISELKKADVDLVHHRVKFNWLKNKSTATLPLSPKIVAILEDYLSLWEIDTEYVFPTVHSAQLTTRSMCHALYDYCKTRNVTPKGPHALRHSFARLWIKNGGGVFQLQQMLTHSTLEMTRRYVRLFADDLEEDVIMFNPLDKMSKIEQKKVVRKKWAF